MQLSPSIYLGQRRISAQDPTYIIAEIGVNHNGSLELAHKLIDAAKKSGADAVKFQTYRTDDLILNNTQKAKYQKEATQDKTQDEMLRNLELPFEAFTELRNHCKHIDIDFMSTAFDPISLDFVGSLKPSCIKWPSGELTNWPLIRQANKLDLPIMLSTGMASLQEIAATMDIIKPDIATVVLQCVSSYPAKIEDQNLRVLPTMQAAFGCPVGFSDHTIGPYAAITARALGMSVLEKHFTLDKNMKGPDHSSSIEPNKFFNMVNILRKIEIGLGDGVKRLKGAELNIKEVARKSLVYITDLQEGHVLQETDFIAKRPGVGIPPNQMELFIGKKLTKPVKCNQLLAVSDV